MNHFTTKPPYQTKWTAGDTRYIMVYCVRISREVKMDKGKTHAFWEAVMYKIRRLCNPPLSDRFMHFVKGLKRKSIYSMIGYADLGSKWVKFT